MSLQNLRIQSPKRNPALLTGWEGFFPYYAGYPEAFAEAVLQSARLPQGAFVLDPWNGSGTTTLAASRLGLTPRGFDLNPVMVIVARARLLAPSEADHLKPLASTLIARIDTKAGVLDRDDPLLSWFAPSAARQIRAIERSIGRSLLGDSAPVAQDVRFDQISGTTATFYVALFSLCRQLVRRFRSTNPTWLRKPRSGEAKVVAAPHEISRLFHSNVSAMAAALAASRAGHKFSIKPVNPDILVADTASFRPSRQSIDFVLTSPPYCTRIDYTAATRIELAVLAPLFTVNVRDLGRRMIGSTQVPDHLISPSADWGKTCLQFLTSVKNHSSKASGGYYYKTHLDYFCKISNSVDNIANALKPAAPAVFVVQDSHYKEIHNDLPTIIGEIAVNRGLVLRRREDFHLKRSMAGIHRHSRGYGRPTGALESVLCFQRA